MVGSRDSQFHFLSRNGEFMNGRIYLGFSSKMIYLWKSGNFSSSKKGLKSLLVGLKFCYGFRIWICFPTLCYGRFTIFVMITLFSLAATY